jgi:hypothetical protein
MRLKLAGLFGAVMVAAFANGRPHPEIDCVSAPYTAWSLVRYGSFDVGRYPELSPYHPYQILEAPGGQRVSIRTPGNALAAVPFVAPLALTRDRPPSGLAMLQLGKAVGAACVAAAACLLFVTCCRFAPAGAGPAAILFAFGTCLFSVASQALWMHGPAALGLSLALYLLAVDRPDPLRLFAAGCALGLAVLARPSTALFALATVAAVGSQRGRATAWLVLGGAPAATLLCFYNYHYFGNLLVGGYIHDNWADTPPLWLGLGGLLVAPSRGVFVYSPALVLALHGAVVLSRRGLETDPTRTLLRSWVVAATVTVLFYARWYEWRGGWCYGPRLLCETMPIACLLFGLSFEALRTRLMRAVAVALVAVSVAVHVVGVYGHGGYVAWHQRHERQDQGRCLFELEDTQIEAHAHSFAHEIEKKLR